MKKKITFILVVILVFFLIGIIKYINFKTLEDSKTKEIILKTNGGVPYVWNCEIDNKDIVKIKKQYKKNKSNENIVGGPVEIHYVVESLKTGNTSIVCKYTSVVNNSNAKINEYLVDVDNKLKIKIKKK